ncbi:MAG: hypothetical protein CSA84_03760 [Actinomycetales bacterium]|nr:MAG: hypothetical protein CSA84_03760 [Actinomycetales bacterium]
MRRMSISRTGAIVVGALALAGGAGVIATSTLTGTGGPVPQGLLVCGSPTLEGPTVAPDRAVVVNPGDNLPAVVDNNAPGTTYYLAAGVHTFPDGLYMQVTPQDGDSFIGAPGAVIDGRHENRYAFGGQAEDVTISHLTVRNFGVSLGNNNEGVVNHDAARGWNMHHLTVTGNAGAGIFLGSDNTIADSCLADNGQYGVSMFHSDGLSNISMTGNEIARNNTDDWETEIPGCGCTGGVKFWDVDGATVNGNYVHHNKSVGLWADTNNRGFTFDGNYIADNDSEGIFYETSYNAVITNNTFARNGWVKGPVEPGFPVPAVYLSESGGDARVPGAHSGVLDVSGNTFIDNWGGVVAWENADRFAGSPANTSNGYSTLVNPDATEGVCGDAVSIANEPFYSDCRWKTQNVTVSNNAFTMDRDAIPGCAENSQCGSQAIISNWGSWPDWSPYQGTVVEQAIARDQNIVWSGNDYTGPWRFELEELGRMVSLADWQAAGQDADSRFNE